MLSQFFPRSNLILPGSVKVGWAGPVLEEMYDLLHIWLSVYGTETAGDLCESVDEAM